MEDEKDIVAPAPEQRQRKVWTPPTLEELKISRTSIHPTTGSDGGTGDCTHL